MTSFFRIARRIDDVSQTGAVLLLVSVCAFLLLPLLLIVIMSFDSRSYLGQFPPPDLTLRWYVRFFSSDYFLKGLKFSIVIAVTATLISTVIGVSAALAINRLSRAIREMLTSVFLSPLVVPGVVIGVALLIFFAEIGLTNRMLRLIGAHVLITFPYALRTTLASVSAIPRSMYEAALSLGANEREAFWTVTLPLARTGIAAGAIFAFAFSFDDVAVSLFLSDPDTYTLPVALISIMYANLDLTIAAAAVLQVIFVVAVVLLLDRLVGVEKVIGSSLNKA
jgi:putative spermidine/putrescine transport system permease protein